MKFHFNRSNGSRSVVCGQTDEGTDMNCVSHFLHLFPKALNRRLFTSVYVWLTEIYQVCSLCGVHLGAITLLLPTL